MLIACKYEEIYAPEVNDFVYITDKAYGKDEILNMEKTILMELNFDINTPSSYRFLERFSKIVAADGPVFNMSRYMLELTLQDYKMLKYTPSEIAASSLILAQKILKKATFSQLTNGPVWPDEIAKVTSYSEKQLKPCCRDICHLL